VKKASSLDIKERTKPRTQVTKFSLVALTPSIKRLHVASHAPVITSSKLENFLVPLVHPSLGQDLLKRLMVRRRSSLVSVDESKIGMFILVELLASFGSTLLKVWTLVGDTASLLESG